jgi:hypothetical protein
VIFIEELLKKNNISYNFLHTVKNESLEYKDINFSKNSHSKPIGRILINTNYPNEIPPRIGNINFIYSMYESDKIHDKWVENINLFYDGVLVPDPWVAEIYEKSGVKKPIYVIPFFISNDSIRSKASSENVFTFGINSGYELRKNHEQVLESFSRIWGNNTSFKLKVHGKFETDIYHNLRKTYEKYQNI